MPDMSLQHESDIASVVIGLSSMVDVGTYNDNIRVNSKGTFHNGTVQTSVTTPVVPVSLHTQHFQLYSHTVEL